MVISPRGVVTLMYSVPPTCPVLGAGVVGVKVKLYICPAMRFPFVSTVGGAVVHGHAAGAGLVIVAVVPVEIVAVTVVVAGICWRRSSKISIESERLPLDPVADPLLKW